jgi:ribose-phosphate pyrophosphokinase
MIIFAFPEQAELIKGLNLPKGDWQWRYFPDGESYIRVTSEVKDKEVIILCSLNQPDTKTLPLIFLAHNLRELGASKITLIAPYLGYMRQDKKFNAGETITSQIFAAILSSYIDALITIDPHLHRHHDLTQIYNCACTAISAASLMARWIKENIAKALIIGPDIESEQWVKIVAEGANAPYIILEKTRHGDRDVDIIIKDITKYKSYKPILVDDIISSGVTMIKAIELLKKQGFVDIVCLATHGLFAGDAYTKLKNTGAKIVTSNTINHPSNVLDTTVLMTDVISNKNSFN